MLLPKIFILPREAVSDYVKRYNDAHDGSTRFPAGIGMEVIAKRLSYRECASILGAYNLAHCHDENQDLAPDSLAPDAFIDDFNAAKSFVISSKKHILVSFKKPAKNTWPLSTVYRGNLISDFGSTCRYYLRGEAGDIDERSADGINDAMRAVDESYSENGGFYDEDGNLYQD